MDIAPFGVEQWMNAHENHCELNLAETCVDSLTVDELLALGGVSPVDAMTTLGSMRLTYGPIEGSDRLRAAVAGLYGRQSPHNIVVTHGAIGANALVHQTLVSRGDRVVSVVPTYQQHTAIPASIGASVTEVMLRPQDGYRLDLDALDVAIGDDCRMVTLTNPNNPTGALLDEGELAAIAALAERVGAYVVCDEVYRGTDQHGDGTTAAMADIYERGISVGSMSKAFSLAGLRLGWLAAPTDVIEAVCVHRDYNTISVGMIDDYLATIAIEHADAILARSRDLTRRNLAIVDAWMAGQPRLTYVKPASATVCLLHYDLDLTSYDFCVQLLNETGVMFTPGSAFGLEGCVRLGFANSTEILTAGLERVGAFLQQFGS